jgi:phenylacetate-coenzyme A ligase PaaK-like adenylate-forming protein
MMATECSAHCGLHFWEDTLILEIVDERNRPVPAGTPGRKVLLTNLWNRVQPLIRYELADAVTLAAGHNPTGRPFARIANVEGRTADILWLPARTGGVVPVHPFILREPFTRMSDIRQYQFHPGRDRLEVSVVLAPNAAQDTLERVRATLTLALAEAGAAAQPVLLRQVDVIERVGSGAKLTLIGPSSLSSEVEALGQPTATRFADHRSPQASILSGDRPGIG